MTSLQLGLIIGGVVLVAGVLIYNWLQERRVRRSIAAAFPGDAGRTAPAGARIEPTLAPAGGDQGEAPPAAAGAAPIAANLARDVPEDEASRDFVPPLDFEPELPASEAMPAEREPAPVALPKSAGAERLPQPDPDVECIVTLQPGQPVPAGALAAALHARVGKPLRWFGRETPRSPWRLLKSDTGGRWTELAACMLLADRTGAATRPLLDRFLRLVAEQAAALPAAFQAPDADAEVARAETLDRMCADVDVQIGITLLKPGPSTIAGTRLRGVAEASGFRLADSGRFEWVQEETGNVLYVLQNFRSDPFTADSLRLGSTPGAVFILDVPRVADPVRVFDQMKLLAKRMAQTLDATLVDDNRRPLTDPALAAIREQVKATATALQAMRVDPGSPRALALFGG
jgi:hypothetical protein